MLRLFRMAAVALALVAASVFSMPSIAGDAENAYLARLVGNYTGTGKLTVILRAPGYADQELTFDDKQDQSPHVTLSLAPDMGAEAAADQGAAAVPADLSPAAVAPNPAVHNPPQNPNPNPNTPRPPQLPRKQRPEKPNNPGTLTDDDVEIIK